MKLNVDEALRYLGIGGQAAESIRASVAAVADKLTAAIQPRYTYRVWSFRARTQRKCWSSAIRPC